MQIIQDEEEIRRASQSFMQNLKKGCRPVDVMMEWGAPAQDTEAFVDTRFGFWFAARETGDGLWFRFGMGTPRKGDRTEPVCDMRLPFSGFDPGREGFFVRFGRDVLAACSTKSDGDGQAFAAFLELHDYGPTIHYVASPEGSPLKAVILASATSPEPALDVFRFVSAVYDYRQWSAHGLAPSEVSASCDTAGPGASRDDDESGPPIEAMVLAGVREQLAKHVQARDVGYELASSPSGGLVLCSADGSPAAVLQVADSLAPEKLYMAIGKLLLSRGNPRAAKFLVLPGTLGPFFSQALFRHDIQAVQYKLTRDMAVVIDTDEIFSAIAAQ